MGDKKTSGAQPGNKNAAKTEPKSERIVIMVTAEQKRSLKWRAGDAPLGPWMLSRILNLLGS